MSIDVATVRKLVRTQFPEWAHLDVRQVPSHGTVNAIFRIGDGLTARFPLTGGNNPSPAEIQEIRIGLQSEVYASKRLLGRTRFATPAPVALGEPGPGFALPWTVQTWLPGTVATDADPGDSVEFAHDLVELITELRAAGTEGDTFHGPGRGGVLADHDAGVQANLTASERLLRVPKLRTLWDAMRELPRGSDPDVMTHSDLMPGNVLVTEGRLDGVLDVGGFGPAEPALELIGAWHLLEAGPRKIVREGLNCDDAEWARGQAWAFEQSMGLVWFYEHTNPVMSGIGRRTLDRILADPAV
ncbi:aminoglycoside phosphotransferase (APT) family kinase protein [Actinoplanes lutulentus]|uniref:Aminoglycoside phosphotransferase (APT) family kinase protein n=1 Tax=Actinoplanes lutulentus TaxID=1287878 RepID=A0A327Z1G2_9ACTN|nr:aminoglycoside phosphotransferase family protein [Actinoplanes lutulentus]MBB2943189.1 aminoglycoside phosphotransferase (APT) family kinase protein [Actinoplanes lutulentus]RAK28255.1 aminoglycoside phosphotransferase (APT) family kinase protein [Actinoplanes lutulentus]